MSDTIEVIATTISGSLRDQRAVAHIGPAFRAVTTRPVRVHVVRSHGAASAAAREIVKAGGRILVSAGGAGTCNAVLEGVHLGGEPPPDLRLAILRKGSADLMGKVLGMPASVAEGAAAIVAGIESGSTIAADVLTVQTTSPRVGITHKRLLGFGGVGVMGEVPRFTEGRAVRWYKGVLGALLGDHGPFYVGLALAYVYWQVARVAGYVGQLALEYDGGRLASSTWTAVLLANGELGPAFPIGRCKPLDSNDFRVLALHYQGLSRSLRQLAACRSGAVMRVPHSLGAEVVDTRWLALVPDSRRPYVVNVDGLRLDARGRTMIRVSGAVRLVCRTQARAGPSPAHTPVGQSAPAGDSSAACCDILLMSC